jgi:hypothetical protein
MDLAGLEAEFVGDIAVGQFGPALGVALSECLNLLTLR